MRKTLAVATIAMMALSSAAYAQSAVSPQATPGESVTNPPDATPKSFAPKTQAIPPTTKMNEGRATTDDPMSKPAPKDDSNGNNMNGGNKQ